MAQSMQSWQAQQPASNRSRVEKSGFGAFFRKLTPARCAAYWQRIEIDFLKFRQTDLLKLDPPNQIFFTILTFINHEGGGNK